MRKTLSYFFLSPVSLSTYILIIPPVLVSCTPQNTATQLDTSTTANTPKDRENDRAQQVFIDYDEAFLKRHPIAATYRGDHRFNDQLYDRIDYNSRMRLLKVTESYLEQLKSLNYEKLNEENKISFDLLFYQCKMILESLTDGYLDMHSMLPISPSLNLPIRLVSLGSGKDGRQPFTTVKDYDNWIKRANEFPSWIKQAINNMDKGIKKKIVYPTIIVDRLIAQLKPFTDKDVDNSLFYLPIKHLPEAVPSSEKKRLALAYHKLIEDTLTPAYQDLYSYLVKTYRPHARSTLGINALPNGSNWYHYLIRKNSTIDMTPETIHALGIAQTKSLFSALQRKKNALNFKGSMPDFLHFLKYDKQFTYPSEHAFINSYRGMNAIVKPRLKDQFSHLYNAPYMIKPIPLFLAESTPSALYVSPSFKENEAGIVYLNTSYLSSRPNYIRDALFLHEAIPGHQLQKSQIIENPNVISFRKYFRCPAYTEGWATYAESLGKSLGLYQSTYQEVGAIVYALTHTSHVVIDTGIHLYGWDKNKATQWLKTYTPLTDHQINIAIDHTVARPAQSVSYLLGSLTIKELKEQAQVTLDASFDIREFHHQILKDGPLTLPILKKKITQWISEQAKTTKPDYPNTAKQVPKSQLTTISQ